MHRYLRSVGLKSLDSKRKVREYLDQVIADPDTVRIIQDGQNGNLAVLKKQLSNRTGIAICGEYEDIQNFRMDSYFPYVIGNRVSTEAPCIVNRQADSDMYEGLCEDYRLGVSIIFFLTNSTELKDARGERRTIQSVSFSGLSDGGKILLPVRKSEKEREGERVTWAERGQMIEAAKNGNTEAMEMLTVDEVTLYHQVSSRIMKEDLYSVIDTFFMPSGLECDQYDLMGEIIQVEEWSNGVTGEAGYLLTLDCNEMPLLISIQRDDLLGEPAVGRRFKGSVWLQGTASFVQ